MLIENYDKNVLYFFLIVKQSTVLYLSRSYSFKKDKKNILSNHFN